MKKVLVLSYHSLPLNVIASYRAEALMKYLPENQIYPVLVTCDFEGKGKGVIHEKLNYGEIYRLPFKKTHDDPFGKVELLTLWINGHLDYQRTEIDIYYRFKDFLFDHLKDHSYDLLIAIFSPFHHIRLASLINKCFKIPYIVDFRDLYDNRIMSDEQIPISSRIKNWITRCYIKRWTRNALFLTAVSEAHRQYLEQLTGVETYEILNGFDKDLIESVNYDRKPFFQISSIGNLQNCQKLNLFYEGLFQFLKQVDKTKVRINFVGITEKYRINASEEIRSNIDNDLLNLKGRIPRNDAIRLAKESAVLIFPTLVGYRGNYTGKLFEYIGIKRNILMFPKHADFERFQDISGIFLANDAKEITQYLLKQFSAWELDGVELTGEGKDRERLTRAYQTRLLTQLIRKNLES